MSSSSDIGARALRRRGRTVHAPRRVAMLASEHEPRDAGYGGPVRQAERRFPLCTAWSPWGPSRGFQHRLAMVAEALGALGTVDVCILGRWRSPELDLDWPPWVGD